VLPVPPRSPLCARRWQGSRALADLPEEGRRPTRAAAPIVSWDDAFGLVKVNPLATWDERGRGVVSRRSRTPGAPLTHRGYRSIGCAPTTRPVAEGEDPRAGRWAGLDKSECRVARGALMPRDLDNPYG